MEEKVIEQISVTPTSATHEQAFASPLGVVDFNGIAQMLRVSGPTLERIIRREREFPRFFKIGARRYVRFDDLQDWIDQMARAA